jgi:hypothetical protein
MVRCRIGIRSGRLEFELPWHRRRTAGPSRFETVNVHASAQLAQAARRHSIKSRSRSRYDRVTVGVTPGDNLKPRPGGSREPSGAGAALSRWRPSHLRNRRCFIMMVRRESPLRRKPKGKSLTKSAVSPAAAVHSSAPSVRTSSGRSRVLDPVRRTSVRQPHTRRSES